jgi:hypothetical protein
MSQAELDRIVVVGKLYSHLNTYGSLYTWGGDRLENLVINPRDEARFHAAYNQAAGGGANAGPGLYVTPSLSDSSEYCAAVDGVLLQVDVPDGIAYIRTSNQPTMQALRTGNPAIQSLMLYRQMPDIPPVLLNHAGTWHCLKTCKNVGFRKFDGRGVATHIIQNALDAIRLANRPVAANVLLAQLRPDARALVH